MRKLKFLLSLFLLVGLLFGPQQVDSQIVINSYRYATASYDTDAQAFIDQIQDVELITLTTAEQDAINALVLGLKDDLLWTQLTVIYPFIGADADSHKYNLKDPVDANTSHRAAYISEGTGVLTHDALGVTTDWNSNSDGAVVWSYFTQDHYSTDNETGYSLSISYYSTVMYTGIHEGLIAAATNAETAAADSFTALRTDSQSMFVRMGGDRMGAEDGTWDTEGVTLGMFTMSDESTTETAYFKDGAHIDASPHTSGTRQANHDDLGGNPLGGTYNSNGLATWDTPNGNQFYGVDYTQGTYGFASWGPDQLTEAEADLLSVTVEEYQQALGRGNWYDESNAANPYNEANTTTGWADAGLASGSVSFSSVTTSPTPYHKTYSLRMEHTGTNNNDCRGDFSFPVENGATYDIHVLADEVVGTNWQIMLHTDEGWTATTTTNIDAGAFQGYSITGTTDATTASFSIYGTTAADNGNQLAIDRVMIYKQ